MRRQFLLAACIAAIVAAALAASSAPALAWDDDDRDDSCVVAMPGARLYPPHSRQCDYCCCRPPAPRWVRPGRAFRVDGYRDGYLRVHHLQASGWIESRCVRSVPDYYCRAAGI
jgi:hypothetical protein